MQKQRIFEKFKEIEENVALIEDNLPSSLKEFKALGLVKDGIYKRLEHSVENIIDIFAVVYSSLNLGVPADDDDILERLKTKKVFDENLIKTVKAMKGLRNILVHRYGTIHDEDVYEMLTDHLSDFTKIKSAVVKHLQTTSKK